MRLFSRVNQVVFLQVGELSEVLIAGLTPEGALSAVHSQMDLRTALRSVFMHICPAMSLLVYNENVLPHCTSQFIEPAFSNMVKRNQP